MRGVTQRSHSGRFRVMHGSMSFSACSPSTIELVDQEEKIMLARVRFQDSLAELTLKDETAPVAKK